MLPVILLNKYIIYKNILYKYFKERTNDRKK